MTNTRDIILQLKEVREQKGLSYNDIINMMPDKDKVSPTTLSRIFRDGSEDDVFSYEKTLRPLANALLDIETIEETDEPVVKALKEIIKLKHERISELEQQLEQIEAAHNKEMLEKMEAFDKEREAWGRSIEFLKEQITLKDARMDMQNDRTNNLLDRIEKKDDQITKLTYDLIAMKEIKDSFDTCPYRTKEHHNIEETKNGK